jgi:hypothetical protein
MRLQVAAAFPGQLSNIFSKRMDFPENFFSNFEIQSTFQPGKKGRKPNNSVKQKLILNYPKSTKP